MPAAQTGSKLVMCSHDGNKLLMWAQGCSDEKRTFEVRGTAGRNARLYKDICSEKQPDKWYDHTLLVKTNDIVSFCRNQRCLAFM